MKTYMHPFPRTARMTQPFGLRGIYNPGGGHTGEDTGVPIGTPVHAAGDGIVEAARYFPDYNNEWLYGPMGGLTLVLDCGANEPSFGYSHLSKVLVRVGEWVRKGQVIALSGNSGTATTGAHCHTEALPPHWNTFNGTYGRVNPRIYMTEFPGEALAARGAITQENKVSEIPKQQAEDIAVRAAQLVLHSDIPWFGFDGVYPSKGRNTTTVATAAGYADAVAGAVLREVSGLKALVNQLAEKQGVVIDYEKIAKAVADEEARRMAQ